MVNGTFRKAYEDLIEVSANRVAKPGRSPADLLHGYDYPWPDGRGAIALGIVGPWFEDSFRKKGFPLLSGDGPDLEQRRVIVAAFIKAVNDMLDGLQTKYAGKVFKVDLLGTLPNRSDWTDELHPTNGALPL